MIKDIPTEADFHGSAARFLETAWSEALGQVEAEKFESEYEDEDTDVAGEVGAGPDAQNIFSDKSSLAIAYIALYTGVEHLLRASIASVSPFLLLAGDIRSWPSSTKDVSFADFKSIEAGELVRVFDTVCPTRLSPSFIQMYDKIRRKRNSLIHSHSQELSVIASDLITTILFATDALVGSQAWFDWRRHRLTAACAHDRFASWQFELTKELDLALRVMGNSPALRHFGIDKKRRRYFCPECLANQTDYERKTCAYQNEVEGWAHLDRNERTLLKCPICATKSKVEREKCLEWRRGCKGDVMFGDWCMTCARDV